MLQIVQLQLQELCQLLAMNKVYTTPYHSASNGQVERSFRTFRAVIGKLTDGQGYNWDELIPHAAYCYNISVNSTTKETPFFLVFGRDPLVSIEMIDKEWDH